MTNATTGNDAGFTAQDYADLIAWKTYFLATFVVLIYDWLITIDIEVARIWQRTRNAFTVLWGLIRYLPMLMYLSASISLFQTNWPQSQCRTFATLPTGFVITAVIIAHTIFMLRVYALYGRSRRVLQVFIPLLLAELCALVYTAFGENITDLPIGLGCLPGSPKRVQGVITWAAPFIFDSAVVSATLYKSIQYLRAGTKSPVLTVFIRDGIVYYIFMLIAYALNIFLYIFAPVNLQDINAGFSTMITIVMTTRLILNLRAVTTKGTAQDTTTSMIPDERAARSQMRFRLGPLTTIMDELDYAVAGEIHTDDTELVAKSTIEFRTNSSATWYEARVDEATYPGPPRRRNELDSTDVEGADDTRDSEWHGGTAV